jgi:hypothetical protein
MKRIILLIVMLAAGELFAQQIKVNWGVEFKNDKKETISDVIHDDGTNIYSTVIARTGGGLFSKLTITPALVKFDNTMQPIKRFDFITNEKDVHYQGAYYLGGKFFFITDLFNKRTNTLELYAQKIDKDLNPEGENMMIWKIIGVKGEETKFKFSFSEDSTKFLIFVQAKQKRKEMKDLALKVFDGKFNTFFEKNIEYPYTEEGMVIKNCQVTNGNEVYAILKVYKEGKAGKDEIKENGKKVPGYDIIIKRYSPDGTEKEVTVDMGGRFLDEWWATDDHFGNLHLFASYEEEFEKGINGFVFMKLDPKTGQIISQSNWQIPMELSIRIALIQDDKSKSKTPAINRKFGITDLKVNDDETVSVILEKNYVVVYTTGGMNGQPSYTHYVYNSEGMIALNIDKSGTVSWYKYLPKIQQSEATTRYMYHAAMFYKDKIYVLFNDEIKNESYDYLNGKKSPKRFTDRKKMNLMMAIIDKDGNATFSLVGNAESMETTIDINLSKQISKSRMMLCGYRYKNDEVKLGTADFE